MDANLYKKLYGIVFIFDSFKNYQTYVNYFFSICTDPLILVEKNSIFTQHLDVYFYHKDAEFERSYYKLRNDFLCNCLQIPEVININISNYKEKIDGILLTVNQELESLRVVYILNTLAIRNNRIVYKKIIVSERQKDVLEEKK